MSLKEAFEKQKSWVLIPNSENMIYGLEVLKELINNYLYVTYEKNVKDFELKFTSIQDAPEEQTKRAKELSPKKKIKANVLEPLVNKYNLKSFALFEINETDMFTIISTFNKHELQSHVKELVHHTISIENKNSKEINDIFITLRVPVPYMIGGPETITFQKNDLISGLNVENYKFSRKNLGEKEGNLEVNEFVISIRELNLSMGLLEQGDIIFINIPLVIPAPKPTDNFSLDISVKMFQFPAGNPFIINCEKITIPVTHVRHRFSLSHSIISVSDDMNCKVGVKLKNLTDLHDFEFKREIPAGSVISDPKGIDVLTENLENKQYATFKFGKMQKDEIKEGEFSIKLNSINEILQISRGW